MRFYAPDGVDDACVRTLSAVVDAEPVVDLERTIEADRDADAMPRAHVEHRIGEKNSVRLNMEAVPIGESGPKPREQTIESGGTKEEGLAAVQDHAEWP